MKFKKIYIEITNSCNLNCDFCIKNQRKKEYLSIEKFKKILDNINNYTDYLYFHIMGEQILHHNINEIIDIASKKFKINITTNGYLIDRIKENKNIRQINISMHSFNDRYKISLEKYLDNVFDSIEKLIKNDTYISLRMWVRNKYNKEMIKYINQRYNIKISENIDNATIKDNLFINNFHEFIWPALNNDYYSELGTCYAIRDHIGILVDGTVVPCCLDTQGIINLGNIYKDKLDNIIKSERIQNMLMNFKQNKKCEELCKHCKFIDKY